MARSLQNFANDDRATPGAAIAPVLMGIVFVALVLIGLILGGNAEDDFTYFAGLTLAGFGLFIGWRYASRLLP